MAKKIAFINFGTFSHINESVRQVLVKYFPDFEVETIDVVKELVAKRKDILLMNMFFVIKEYGLAILLGRNNVKTCFFHTTYLFKKIKALVSSHLSKDNFACTFQTQSLFDASTEGLPHFVYTDHTHLENMHYPGFNKNELNSKSWIKLEKSIYQNARINFTMSTNISQSLIEQYSCKPDKVVCVYAGSNTKFENAPLGNRIYNNKNILFVGFDWERKGGPVLIEAFKVLLTIHPDAQLTIVGCSPHIALPNCSIVGRVPLKEVRSYFEKASVFCLPTNKEPFGIVFIEALMHKLPIVATNIGSIPDFVLDGESGYLVKPNDVEQLAEAMTNLVGNPNKCQTYGEIGFNMAMDRYSWEKVGSKFKQNMSPIIARQSNEHLPEGVAFQNH